MIHSRIDHRRPIQILITSGQARARHRGATNDPPNAILPEKPHY